MTSTFSPQSLITDTLFTVVDCETTGFSAELNRIVQLGAVIVSGSGDLLNEFETIVCPESPAQYGHAAEDIHGITAAQVQNGMPLHRALQLLHSFGSAHIFVAHNALFDIGFIRAEAERVQLIDMMSPWLSTYLDTVAMSRRVDPESTRSHKLGEVCSHYGVALDHAHNALADARAAAQLLPHLFADLGITHAHQLAELAGS